MIAALTDLGPADTGILSTLSSSDLLAPHLIDLEVVQRLRRYDREGRTGTTATLRRYRLIPIKRIGHEPLLPRIWELRHNLSAYDATYVALAEASGTPLLTLDRKLANAPGHHAEIVVL